MRTTEMYQKYYDISYPGLERESARPLRVSPVYEWHREHGASFGEKAGWERVNYYETNVGLGDETLRPQGWAGRTWSPATGAEHHATRTTAALFDETSFAKLSVTGPDAAAFLDWVCDNEVARAVGDITYTQALNARGGIEADFTVTRRREDEFLVVTGTAFGTHDQAWLRKRAREDRYDVRVEDITGSLVCFGLWGPEARAILDPLTPVDVSDEAFPFMTAQATTVGEVPVLALRVTFTGEHGWEVYAAADYGAALWSRLVDAGSAHGLRPGGYRAIESLRLERGYRVWGSDLTPETNPFEAGLGLLREPPEAGRVLRRRGDAGGQGDRSLPAAVLRGARRPAARRTRWRAGQRRGCGHRARDVGWLRLHGRVLYRVRLPPARVGIGGHGRQRGSLRESDRRHRRDAEAALVGVRPGVVTHRRGGSADVVVELELAPEGDLGLGRDPSGPHDVTDLGTGSEEPLERLGVRPHVEDHDLIVGRVEPVIAHAVLLAPAGDHRHRLRVVGNQLLELRRVALDS